MIKNNNIMANRDNLLKADDEVKFLVGGNKKIYLYNIKGESFKEIYINIYVCTGLKLSKIEYSWFIKDDKDYMFDNTEKH
jgi:hypothetical protein